MTGQSDWQTINTTPCPQYFSTCDCWISEQVIEMYGHGSPGGISFAEVNHFFPLMSLEQSGAFDHCHCEHGKIA